MRGAKLLAVIAVAAVLWRVIGEHDEEYAVMALHNNSYIGIPKLTGCNLR
jgi:hypothetical protein